MSIGSVLIGIAVLAVVTAYVARPFRQSTTMSLDRTIEAWVAEVREAGREEAFQPVEGRGPARALNYCPQCGQQVHPGDRFCSGCGTRLSRRTE